MLCHLDLDFTYVVPKTWRGDQTPQSQPLLTVPGKSGASLIPDAASSLCMALGIYKNLIVFFCDSRILRCGLVSGQYVCVQSGGC